MRRTMALASMPGLILALGGTPEPSAAQVPSAPVSSVQVAPARTSPTETLGWMAGCWAAGGAGPSRVEELWTRPGGGIMLGVSRTLRDGALTGFEHLLLRARGDTAIYRASPSGQATTEFASTHVSDTLAVFENPEHDFPRKISYRRAPGDSLHARVEGTGADGSPTGFIVRYGRSNCP